MRKSSYQPCVHFADVRFITNRRSASILATGCAAHRSGFFSFSPGFKRVVPSPFARSFHLVLVACACLLTSHVEDMSQQLQQQRQQKHHMQSLQQKTASSLPESRFEDAAHHGHARHLSEFCSDRNSVSKDSLYLASWGHALFRIVLLCG